MQRRLFMRFGTIILLIGIICLISSLAMDTSVEVKSPLLGTGRISNLSLMQSQNTCMTLSCLLVIVGVGLIIAGAFSPKVDKKKLKRPGPKYQRRISNFDDYNAIYGGSSDDREAANRKFFEN